MLETTDSIVLKSHCSWYLMNPVFHLLDFKFLDSTKPCEDLWKKGPIVMQCMPEIYLLLNETFSVQVCTSLIPSGRVLENIILEIT